MTNPDVLKAIAAKAILEAIDDIQDEDEARQAVELIKAILAVKS